MPDRANYLAHQLLKRRNALEAALLDDPSEHDHSRRRQEMVEKVLAVEAGITDGVIVQLVLSAMPTFSLELSYTDREQEEFAEFLRHELESVQ